MVDFIGILKKKIDAQNNITPQLREQIYKQAFEILEHKFLEIKMPKKMADAQRQALQSAIVAIEEGYLTAEKELLSSVMGWDLTGKDNNNENVQKSILSQSGDASAVVTEEKKQQPSVSSRKSKKALDKLSVESKMSNTEPTYMDTSLAPCSSKVHSNIKKNARKNTALQTDTSVVSHIFAQALRRANRSIIKKRILIGIVIFIVFFILLISAFFVGEYMFASYNNQIQEVNIQASNGLQKEGKANQKLTQRLLEDGSEVDAGSIERTDKKIEFLSEEEVSTLVAGNSKTIEHPGEAIFYKTHTDYDSEKVVMGNAWWSLIKESSVKNAPEELAIRGDINIPSEGLLLQLTLRRNIDPSFPTAYIMDLVFMTTDKFSGQAIHDIKELTFKASKQSIGQPLKRASVAKIDDDFFLFALSNSHPFLDQNLQIIRELDWIHLVISDKNGHMSELTFAKGPTGESIFNEVIEQWLAQTAKQTIFD
ncbi:hypothetical protein [Bartonella melophagi]|uniref:Transmembrane protein n=1 Tax=Bartonella melophagi K-2C TaxID=1094557 RepID=J1JV69_9HYPH|nr:hypothetical protein [Bartonella melophagi]EJF88400.1 hypothetical protein ME3_01098 [Bartonella melophagi K-2C]